MPRAKNATPNLDTPFWSIPEGGLLDKLGATREGLSSAEAARRLAVNGSNRLNNGKTHGNFRLFIGQFKNSIILILLCATALSYFLEQHVDAAIIITIVLISGCLGFWQEKGASDAVAKLLMRVQIRVNAIRDGNATDIATQDIVPGDILTLKAGDVIPGDCRILASNNLFVDESALTGESFPSAKSAGILPAETPLSRRSNALWMGTHVQSGTGQALVVNTGAKTEFGKLSSHVGSRRPETEFERGIRHFGYLLMEITLVLVILIFAFNVYLHRPVIDSFLFALALAVGLTPQLLPAVISVNLAYGAKRMAERQVIVKQLTAIENLGSMNVLCSDKTGTLTEGVVHMRGALDINGDASEKVALFAYLNASYESGFNNPIDEAVRQCRAIDISGYTKLAEIPYDFHRKRLSVLASHAHGNFLVSKGALNSILAICTTAEMPGGESVPLDSFRENIQRHYAEFSRQGIRTLGLAYKAMPGSSELRHADEVDLCFLGYLLFFDPPKQDCRETVQALRESGVSLKIITGDNRLVASTLSAQLGLNPDAILTGAEISQLNSKSLMHQAASAEVFADVEPNQKEQIILALKKAGFVVGYMGDGINDVSALHAADVGISVDSAADAAKETAQVVLMEKDLRVLLAGIREGRITFANTLKYVFMATSSNFGNMFSMAGASLFLPFLPLLPKQILMTNLLTDGPEMTIASDRVDEDMVAMPRRWDIGFIRKFMMTFGLVSSLFDFLTFAVLLALGADAAQFRTGWFMESVISAALIVFVVRSRQPFFRSRPSNYLILATCGTILITLALPYSPLADLAGFQALPPRFMAYLAGIVLMYLTMAELTKYVFYRFLRA